MQGRNTGNVLCLKVAALEAISDGRLGFNGTLPVGKLNPQTILLAQLSDSIDSERFRASCGGNA